MRLYALDRNTPEFAKFDVRSKAVTRIFVLDSTYEERATPKSAGFWFNWTTKQWWTFKVETAAKLASHVDCEPTLKAELTTAHDTRTQTLAASRATSADITLPKPDGLDYMPFQKAGIAFLLDRPRVLLADEPGLGKTIQALGVINARPEIRKVLVICPASIKINWAREAEKWLVRTMRISIADGKQCDVTADMVIINFDIAYRYEAELRSVTWDLLVVDECHKLKSKNARRTKFILGYTPRKKDDAKPVAPIPSTRAILMTGTPIVNRPIEGWNLFSYLDPRTWSSFFSYAIRYAAAHKTEYGWDFSGASNLDELQEKLRSTIMIRRLKAEVLKELPAKVRQVITLTQNGLTGQIEHEDAELARFAPEIDQAELDRDLAEALDDKAAYEAAVDRLRSLRKIEFEAMSRLSHETALAKVPYVVDHVLELLEAQDKCVVMAHHADVIEALVEGLGEYNPVHLTGADSLTNRDDAVQAFQNDPATRVFVGSIQAAGVGLTLTASSWIVFAELDWVPGNMSQAEDRCHRIGQHDVVNVQHIVVDRSIDARRAKVLLEKQAVIDKALDNPIKDIPIDFTVRKVAADPEIAPERIAAVHDAIKFLAQMDPDRALERNMIGFNGADGRFGHRLAELRTLTPKQALAGIRLVKKYHRQIVGRFGVEIMITLYGRDDELVREHATKVA